MVTHGKPNPVIVSANVQAAEEEEAPVVAPVVAAPAEKAKPKKTEKQNEQMLLLDTSLQGRRGDPVGLYCPASPNRLDRQLRAAPVPGFLDLAAPDNRPEAPARDASRPTSSLRFIPGATVGPTKV